MATINESILEARNRGATDEQILLEITNQNPDKTSQFQEAVSRGASPSQIVSEIGEQNKRGFFTRLKQAFGSQETRARARQLETLEGRRGRLDMGDIADVAGGIPSLAGFIGGGALGGLLGGAGGAIAGSAGGAGLGEGVRQAIGGVLGTQERFEPKEVALETAFGAIPGVGGKLLKPFAKGLRMAFKPIKNLRIPEFVSSTDFVQAAKGGFLNPRLQRQITSGEFTEDTLAGIIRSATKDFRTKSFTAFKTGLSTMKGKVSRDKTLREINSSIRKEFELSERGVILEGLVERGVLPKELNQIKTLLHTTNKYKDFSVQGVQKLKTIVNKFWKDNPDYNNLNRVVSLIAGEKGVLNTVSKAADKTGQLDKLLKSATKDIDLLKKLKINVIGKNADRIEVTPNNIKAMIVGLDDPSTRQASIALIKELELVTGIKLMPFMQAIADANVLRAKITKSGLIPRAEEIIGRSSASIARGLGDIRDVTQPIRRQVSPVVTPATRIGLFEALRGSQQ